MLELLWCTSNVCICLLWYLSSSNETLICAILFKGSVGRGAPPPRSHACPRSINQNMTCGLKIARIKSKKNWATKRKGSFFSVHPPWLTSCVYKPRLYTAHSLFRKHLRAFLTHSKNVTSNSNTHTNKHTHRTGSRVNSRVKSWPEVT